MITSDLAVIGAYLDEVNGINSGSAYIYRYNGTDWIKEAKLLASDSETEDRFGVSVSISGDIAVIGSWGDDDNGSESGSAYIYKYDPEEKGWFEIAPQFIVSDGEADDYFGFSVSISGEIVMVGAYCTPSEVVLLE